MQRRRSGFSFGGPTSKPWRKANSRRPWKLPQSPVYP